MNRYHENERSFGREPYRQSNRHTRSPPRSYHHRPNHSPPRRGRTPPPYNDAQDPYFHADSRRIEHPSGRSDRRRSRSPVFRGRDGGNYRGRPRSPQRIYSPRRDPHLRSPPRRIRGYSRSPPAELMRARSPYPTKRVREPSPFDARRPRSPPYVKRERYVSPQRSHFERRAYSPSREDVPRYSREVNYRPVIRERSRSPMRRSEHISRMESPISSHRSSPQIHPDRMVMTGSGTHSPAIRTSRPPPIPQSPGYRDRSPPRRRYTPPAAISPPRESKVYRQRSPPPPRQRDSPPLHRERNDFRNGSSANAWSERQAATPQESAYRTSDARGPPNGPPYNGSYARDPPPGPPLAPISMSAHNRPGSAALLSAPTRPRGGPSFERGAPREASYNGPPPRRGSHHQQSAPYHQGPPRHSHSYDSERPSRGPPAQFDGRPPFRPNNSSSTTYPRTQRFHPQLSGLPSVVPGGKLAASSLDPAAEKRLAQLEEDRKRLLEAIEEKQKGKRKGLREWERVEGERRRDGLRSELAEASLERMQGEVEGDGKAAF